MSEGLSHGVRHNLLTSSSAPPYDALLENGLADFALGGPSVVEEKE